MNQVKLQFIAVTVVAAGTAVRVSDTSVKVASFEVRAPSGNSGVIYVGDESVDSTAAPRSADSSTTFTASDDASSGDYFDLSEVYLDAANAADTAVVTFLKITSNTDR